MASFNLSLSGIKKILTDVLSTITINSSPTGLHNGGRVTVVTINNTGWTPLPAVPLVKRNAVAIQNYSGQEIKVNYDPTVVGYIGMIIPNQGERDYDITDTILIYAMASTSTCTLNIEEIS